MSCHDGYLPHKFVLFMLCHILLNLFDVKDLLTNLWKVQENRLSRDIVKDKRVIHVIDLPRWQQKEIKNSLTWNRSEGEKLFCSYHSPQLNLIKIYNNGNPVHNGKRLMMNSRSMNRVVYHDTKHANSIITCHSSSLYYCSMHFMLSCPVLTAVEVWNNIVI